MVESNCVFPPAHFRNGFPFIRVATISKGVHKSKLRVQHSSAKLINKIDIIIIQLYYLPRKIIKRQSVECTKLVKYSFNLTEGWCKCFYYLAC